MASPEFGLSGTLGTVGDELRDEPVTAGQVAASILRMRPNYADGTAASFHVAWPEPGDPAAARMPMSRWLAEVARYLHPAARGVFTGRRAIIGLGLADGPTGRALERSGLGHALAVEERIPPLRDRLTEAGLRLIGRRMPLVAASLGLAGAVHTREGPDVVSDIAFPPDAGRSGPVRGRVGRPGGDRPG